MLGLTNAFIAPLIKIFDPIYYLNRFMRWRMDRSPLNRLRFQCDPSKDKVAEFNLTY